MFVVILTTILAWAGAQLVARRYRARMVALMTSTGESQSASGSASEPPSRLANRPPLRFVDAGQQRARLLVLLMGLCLAMALTRAWIDLQFLIDGPATPRRVLVVGLVYTWPAVFVLAVLNRWWVRKTLLALGTWLVPVLGVVMLNSGADQSFVTAIAWLAVDALPPALIVLMLTQSGATRAVAPWIWPPLAALVTLSALVLTMMQAGAARDAEWLQWLAGTLGANGAALLLCLGPWVLALPLAKGFGRALASAYTAKRISDLTTLFAAIWGIGLLAGALARATDTGISALALLLPLAWIPVALRLARSYMKPGGRPPTLLVLRVFRRDAEVQELFDQVIERWRLVGNTVLIAGTDLVDRTMDADDVFTLIDGRLASRFIHDATDLQRHVAEFDLEADAEGRFRVNECYCGDRSWQLALARLVELSDVVLMDLRGFTADHRGCRHELQVLAATPSLARVVVLTDDTTRIDLAHELAGSAPPDRFVWLASERGTAAAPRMIFHALLPVPRAGT
ncbi:MAG: hypothetical protein ACT4PZ_21755 [Panacagrimonas sp.]